MDIISKLNAQIYERAKVVSNKLGIHQRKQKKKNKNKRDSKTKA